MVSNWNRKIDQTISVKQLHPCFPLLPAFQNSQKSEKTLRNQACISPFQSSSLFPLPRNFCLSPRWQPSSASRVAENPQRRTGQLDASLDAASCPLLGILPPAYFLMRICPQRTEKEKTPAGVYWINGEGREEGRRSLLREILITRLISPETLYL